MDDTERVLVDVWDWPTRILHWLNAGIVIALIVLIIGAEWMEELGVARELRRPVKEAHACLGHLFMVTLFLRIIWGFIGNRYARFTDIVPLKGWQWQAIGHNIKWYLSGFKGRAAKVTGHDPLAALFYTVLFIVLIGQALTGMLLSGAEFNTFPGSLFTGGMSEEALEGLEEALEGPHKAGFLFILLFIAAHLIGLVAHELKEKTGLLTSMVNGKKCLRKEDVDR
ncbi:MAG: cytochrome b/b6 domain-containing protein [Deltaproteobacteria bacterium]|nr:cytochrome b/b6 domain-containing protein [Deltaproteobacteria bacterium]